jgi:phosphoribosylamine--glycine ligase
MLSGKSGSREMKVLLIGHGAREHAMADAVARSVSSPQVYAYMSHKNPGIARLSKEFKIGGLEDADKIASFAAEKGVDFAIVGPEAALAAGVADALQRKGIPSVGPTRRLAMLEADKSFARNMLRNHNIEGCPEFRVFSDATEAENFVDELEGRVAIKPAGLTSGKGVKVYGSDFTTVAEAVGYVKELTDRSIGDSHRVVVEKALRGEEFTLQAFVSGTDLVFMPIVRDFKRAHEGDTGPLTGGMGSYSAPDGSLPFLREYEVEKAKRIMRRTMEALWNETGEPYMGILYGGFMNTAKGPFLLEFNVRFGDPEAMNVLSMLRSDFTEVLESIVSRRLSSADLRFDKLATVCKYIVPSTYPFGPFPRSEVMVDEEGAKGKRAAIYYGSVDEENGKLYTTSSRSVAVVGVSLTLKEAETIAELAASCVQGQVCHRNDIGKEWLTIEQTERMRRIREEGS